MKFYVFILCLFLTINSSVISELEDTLKIRSSTICDLGLIKAYGLSGV